MIKLWREVDWVIMVIERGSLTIPVIAIIRELNLTSPPSFLKKFGFGFVKA